MERPTHSMTGVGFAAGPSELGEVRIEVRSVNGKGLSIKLRLPAVASGYEAAIEDLLRAKLVRGSVMVVLERTQTPNLLPDRETLRTLADGLRSMAAEFGLPAPGLGEVVQLALAAGRSETMTARPLPPLLRALLERAATELMAHRLADGRGTTTAILAHLDDFDSHRAIAAARAPQWADEYRDKLLARTQEFVARYLPAAPPAFDVVREVAAFSDRVNVDEELQRLAAHVGELRAVLRRGGEAGRRLEFLLQELLRETNTLGSKSPDPVVAHAVVAMKSCIDRIKEQAANLE